MRGIGRRLIEAKSFKAFGFEVLVVVVGVLIALGAQEAVDDWNWRRNVEQGEIALKRQNNWLSLVLAEQIVFAPCATAQIDRLAARLREPGPWQGMPIQDRSPDPRMFRLVARPVGDVTWQRLLNDGTASHMDLERRVSLASFHIQRERLDNRMLETRELATSLLFLAEPAALDATTRFAALRTLGELRANIRSQASISVEMLGYLRDLGHLAPRSRFDEFMAGESGELTAYCRAHDFPLGDWRSRLAQWQTIKV